MNILFIGGTGNISTDCAALLHERGHQIGVVTRVNALVRYESGGRLSRRTYVFPINLLGKAYTGLKLRGG